MKNIAFHHLQQQISSSKLYHKLNSTSLSKLFLQTRPCQHHHLSVRQSSLLLKDRHPRIPNNNHCHLAVASPHPLIASHVLHMLVPNLYAPSSPMDQEEVWIRTLLKMDRSIMDTKILTCVVIFIDTTITQLTFLHNVETLPIINLSQIIMLHHPNPLLL